MKRAFMRNNKGVTLTEVIVVVAIIAVFVTAGIYSFSQVTSGRVRKAAKEINSLLAECKVNALAGSAEQSYLRIFKESDGYIYCALYEGVTAGESGDAEDEVERRKLGNKFACSIETSGGTYVIADEVDVCIGFERGNGSICPLSDFYGNAGIDGEIKAVTVSGGAFSYTIELVPATGYHGFK